MTLQDELSQLIDPRKNTLSGVLGISTSVVTVDSRPGFVWVRLMDNTSELIQAHNDKVSPIYGMPVILSYDGIKYSVMGRDVNRYTNWKSDAAFLPDHAGQHSAVRGGGGGSDIVWVDSQQFLPLLVLPVGRTGTNSVTVSPHSYRNSSGNWVYAGNTGTTIPPSRSITGSTMYLIMLNDTDGTFYGVTGSVFPANLTGSSQVVPYIPKYTNLNDKPLAAIRMSLTGTVVSWDNLYDVRQMYGASSSPTGSASYLETIGIFASGTYVGAAKSIDFVGNYTVSISGTSARAVSLLAMPSGTAGMMSGGDKSKLDNIALNATNGITVKEVDGTPTVVNVNRIVVTNGTLTDDGSGQVSIDTGGGGGGTYGLDPIDCTAQVTGSEVHFTFTPAASSVLVLLNGTLMKPADVTLDVDGLGVTLTFPPEVADNLIVIRAASTSVSSGHVIQDNGTPMTDRPNLNFIGMTVADNSGNSSTDVTITVPPALKVYLATNFQ